jgi:predicted nucleic acid-binding protein
MNVFIDSDVLIWHLRGEKKARDLLKALVDEDVDLWIGAMQRAEIVFFMRPEEEQDTLDLLSLFKTHLVDQAVIDEAGKFYRKWNPSHGIDPNDAILAATVAISGGRIITQNTDHYPMPQVVVQKAW